MWLRRTARTSRSAPSCSASQRSSRTKTMFNIRRRFRNLSLARKLTAIGVATSTASVAVVAVDKHIVSAALFLLDGTVFAKYHREGQTSSVPPAVGADVLDQHRP